MKKTALENIKHLHPDNFTLLFTGKLCLYQSAVDVIFCSALNSQKVQLSAWQIYGNVELSDIGNKFRNRISFNEKLVITRYKIHLSFCLKSENFLLDIKHETQFNKF